VPGPILVLIYINNIVDNMNCNAYLFADDMKIFNRIPDDTYINQSTIQSDINTVSKWTDKWHLKLNAEKCKITTVGKAHPSHTHIYKLPVGIGSQDLNRVTQVQDLRLLVDSNLSFESHILSKVKTCNRIRGLIKRNLKNMNFQCFLLLYKSMIRSHLEYAQTAWSLFRAKLIEEVEKVQKLLLKNSSWTHDDCHTLSVYKSYSYLHWCTEEPKVT